MSHFKAGCKKAAPSLYYYQPNSSRAETIFLLSFVSQIVIEIKFFSASPRLRGATGFLRFFSVSPCLRGGFCFLVAARLRCASVVGFGLWLWLVYAVLKNRVKADVPRPPSPFRPPRPLRPQVFDVWPIRARPYHLNPGANLDNFFTND